MAVWKYLEGYKFQYRVSDEGIVEKLIGENKWQKIKSRKIISGKNSVQYLFRLVLPNGKRTQISAKRLVWTSFNGPVPEGYAVFGKAGGSDYSLVNLELRKIGETKPHRRPVVAYDSNGEIIAAYRCAEDAAKAHFMCVRSVRRRCKGETQNPFKFYDYSFRYDDGKK